MAEQTRQQQIEEFEQARKKHTDDWLQSFRTAKRCAWCGWADKLNRRDLCSPCNRIRRRLETASTEDLSDHRVQSRIKRAEAEKNNAVKYGIQFKALIEGIPSGLNLEHLFTELGERMTGENLFHGDSHELAWTFDGPQRAILAALLWMILSRHAHKCRRHYAAQDRLYAAIK